jgi:hypothetical protein
MADGISVKGRRHPLDDRIDLIEFARDRGEVVTGTGLE